MTEERRQHQRTAYPFEGSWTGASGAAPCRIGDMSLGGCYVQSRSVPGKDEQTTVTVEIGNHRFSFRGRVVYAESGMGFAVEFEEISGSESEQLNLLLRAMDKPTT